MSGAVVSKAMTNNNAGKNGTDIESGAMPVPDIPAWTGMPAPKPVMVLSWEDVWVKLHDALQRSPTREEVEHVFNNVAAHMGDVLIEDFWIHIEEEAEAYASSASS